MAEEPRISEAGFILDKITITDYSKDNNPEEEVSDDEFSIHEEDEDLSTALQAVQEQAEDAQILASRSVLTSKKAVQGRPQAVDDYFCNFLGRLGMSRTLNCFQSEWYELLERGVVTVDDAGLVPNIHTRNEQLEIQNLNLKKDLEKYKHSARETKEALQKMQRERDFHRMHHKQTVQEKNRLISEIKRLKEHYASYETVLKELSEKYQTALTQKMLTSLERDKAVGQVTGLRAVLESLECGYTKQMSETKGHDCSRSSEFEGPTQKALREARQQKIVVVASSSADPFKDVEKKTKKDLKDSEFPEYPEVTPYLEHAKEHAQPLKSGEYQMTSIVKVHQFAVTCMALHPRKDIVLSGGDDYLWKMWGFPDGNILTTGEGHTDWISGCCFRPSGTQLVTSSGDTTLRMWDLSRRSCVLTLRGHSRAVRACSWHSCGDFVASASADRTSKIWDVSSERCRYTLHGHEDSVNSIEFLPFTNTLLTCSADKTVSLWDFRTGLRVHTFQGHMHCCNHATFNKKGDTIASCDSSGVMKLWDMRKLLPVLSIDAGPHPANQVAFDCSGGRVAVASSEGSVRVLCVAVGRLSVLRSPAAPVRCVRFKDDDHLLSGGADGRVCCWT